MEALQDFLLPACCIDPEPIMVAKANMDDSKSLTNALLKGDTTNVNSTLDNLFKSSVRHHVTNNQ